MTSTSTVLKTPEKKQEYSMWHGLPLLQNLSSIRAKIAIKPKRNSFPFNSVIAIRLSGIWLHAVSVLVSKAAKNYAFLYFR